ncbi:hypothetical protein BDA96_08G126600 [Sorghum bicolor]|uniref:Uncharacterized protein n=1 Tax=Sorghum bicolor TaxID=4558 RepID=A0A921QGB8_SORBI|nr:hypothetical protein BDA96_08G126600 [Sorghum bicolor]
MAAARAKAVQRSLQVIKMLAETTGSTGKQLRREVAEIVFTVSNIRAVLRHAPAAHVGLRRLGAEVLTRLAMDADARERIGGTGGVVALLLDMFLRPGGGSSDEDADAARVEAGEALAMLALESPRNCERILRGGGGSSSLATTSTTTTTTTVDSLVDALGDAAIGVEAGRILTNLCAYTGGSSEWFPQLRRATRGAATVLRDVAATVNESKPLEVSLGLAAQLVRLMGPHELAHHLVSAGVTEADLVSRLVSVLATYACPSIKAPRIRRFTVELVVALLRTPPARERWLIAEAMAAAGMGAELRRVAETTSELECFHVFSGSAGVSRHAVGLAALVDTALELMGTTVAGADRAPRVSVTTTDKCACV